MEEIYMNVKPVKTTSSTNQTGPSRSGASCPRAVVLFLVLLSFLLLVGLICVSVHCHYSVQRLAAERLNTIKRLQAKEDKISSLTAERDLLNASITQMTKELIRLPYVSKQVKTCPAGWTVFNSTCYLLSTQPASWENAGQDCRDRGADLVIVDTYEEQVFLSNLTEGTMSWMGLTDLNEEGTWRWIDGSPLTLGYWVPEQPDNGRGVYGEEDCAHFRVGTKTANWNDLSCNTPLQWICEKMASQDL